MQTVWVARRPVPAVVYRSIATIGRSVGRSTLAALGLANFMRFQSLFWSGKFHHEFHETDAQATTQAEPEALRKRIPHTELTIAMLRDEI